MLEWLIVKTISIYIHKRKDYKPYLSKRELELLHLILQEHTSQQIAVALFLSRNTVECHRANLFAKGGAKNLVGLVKMAYNLGLIDK